MSVPSLHSESTDSLIVVVNNVCISKDDEIGTTIESE